MGPPVVVKAWVLLATLWSLSLVGKCNGEISTVGTSTLLRPVGSESNAAVEPLTRNSLYYAPGHTRRQHVVSPLPHTYVDTIPPAFSWDNVNGTNYLTKSLNQHVPQWCGSCWAHAAMSSLADRIKIARHAAADDVHLSIQYLLNCGADVAGSCMGGSPSGAYQFIHDRGFIPYDTCQPYLACSADSTHGFCPYVNTSCAIRINTCQTCTMKIEPSLHPFGQVCRSIEHFPNATVAEYGEIRRDATDDVLVQVQAEILARGPVTASLFGAALHTYRGGVYDNTAAPTAGTHSVSIVGWGVHDIVHDDDAEMQATHWIVRNSWGQYFGEMGYVRILAGSNILGIEESIVWATPGTFTTQNWPCSEDGTDCDSLESHEYVDPSTNLVEIQRRLDLYR